MTIKSVALFSSLLLLKLTLAAQCMGKIYNFPFAPGCVVSEELQISFAIKNYTQPQECPSPDTVCVFFRAITAVELLGTFPATVTSIKIAGEGKTAELPIVYAPKTLAKELVAEFPAGGTLTYDEKKVFTFPEIVAQSATQIGGDDSNFIRDKTGNCDVGKLCYALTTVDIAIWGTIGTFKSIIISPSTAADFPVEIPLIQMTANSERPIPAAIQLTPDTEMTTLVLVSFVIETVTDAGTNPQLQEWPACQLNKPCYLILGPTTATFKGKIPANPVTITVSGGTQTNTYIFGSAGTALKSGLLALMTASTAFLGAPI